MKIWAGIAATVLALAVLSGCGDETEAYCDGLEDAKEALQAVDNGDIDQYGHALPVINDLHDEAPDAVQADWKKLGAFMDEAESYYDDIAAMHDEPDDVSMDDIEELHENKPDAQDPELVEASDSIRKHAKDECELTLKK